MVTTWINIKLVPLAVSFVCQTANVSVLVTDYYQKTALVAE